ncbi:MAG TPA: M23 family metallopeptidase [Myxococcota bacterium]|nr:M23 family metallopeptidase [Myxococcota bacterium]
MNRIQVAVFAAFLVLVAAGPAWAVKFRFPIIDVERIQFDYVVYADHDPADGVMTWACLPWCAGTWINRYVECTENFPFCYDAHDGTDFMLIDGFSMMDSGSAQVVAAADGTVIATEDGNYDRCHADIVTQDVTCDGYPMRGNYVKLRHSDGMETWYWHFKKDSIQVEVDQQVKCGDVLGLVGSSGYSSAPHLHFEVRMPTGVGDETAWIDPFAGPHSQEESYWVLQYDPTTWLPGAYCEGDEIPDFPEPETDQGGTADVPAELAASDEAVSEEVSGDVVEPLDASADGVSDATGPKDVPAVDVGGFDLVVSDLPADAGADGLVADAAPAVDTGLNDNGQVLADSGVGDSVPGEPSGGCSSGPRAVPPFGLLLMVAGAIFAFVSRRRGLFS